jgi:hypothetical protein
MKLQQGQVWQQGGDFYRIVNLERLAVGYKRMADPASGVGEHSSATKKAFCRLIKGATLLPPHGPTPVPPPPPPAA